MLEAAAADRQNNAVGQSERPKSSPYPHPSEGGLRSSHQFARKTPRVGRPTFKKRRAEGNTPFSPSAPKERFNSMFIRARKFRARKNLWSSRSTSDTSVVRYDPNRRCESARICTRQYDKRAGTSRRWQVITTYSTCRW